MFLFIEVVFVVELIIFEIQLIEFKLYFFFDNFSLLFLLIVRLISMVIFIYRKRYIILRDNLVYFLVLTFIFILSIFIVITRLNLWLIL